MAYCLVKHRDNFHNFVKMSIFSIYTHLKSLTMSKTFLQRCLHEDCEHLLNALPELIQVHQLCIYLTLNCTIREEIHWCQMWRLQWAINGTLSNQSTRKSFIQKNEQYLQIEQVLHLALSTSLWNNCRLGQVTHTPAGFVNRIHQILFLTNKGTANHTYTTHWLQVVSMVMVMLVTSQQTQLWLM
jgi:hypothetical protein